MDLKNAAQAAHSLFCLWHLIPWMHLYHLGVRAYSGQHNNHHDDSGNNYYYAINHYDYCHYHDYYSCTRLLQLSNNIDSYQQCGS
ncbi:unnamed protein product [Caenorhabditis sp. 36 PRJEB53466]|nr:unnamed protein product [Caenorhabditis sp. 36 PRJEB53466]